MKPRPHPRSLFEKNSIASPPRMYQFASSAPTVCAVAGNSLCAPPVPCAQGAEHAVWRRAAAWRVQTSPESSVNSREPSPEGRSGNKGEDRANWCHTQEGQAIREMMEN